MNNQQIQDFLQSASAKAGLVLNQSRLESEQRAAAAEELATRVCSDGKLPSISNNPELKENIGVGAFMGATATAIAGYLITEALLVGAPEETMMGKLILAFMGEPMMSTVIIAANAGSYEVVGGGAGGALMTEALCSQIND